MIKGRKRQGPSADTAEAFGENGSGANHTDETLNPNVATSNTGKPEDSPSSDYQEMRETRRKARATPVLNAYIARIRAKQLNFRRYVVEEREQSSDGRLGYPRIRATIALSFDPNKNEARLTFQGDLALKPTEEESAAVAAEFAAATIAGRIPTSIFATKGNAEDQRKRLNVSPERWTPFFHGPSGRIDRNGFHIRDQITMCEERRDLPDGSKFCVPWTLWSDGHWYQMEPYGSLPLCWTEKHSRNPIMVHEGPAKAAFLEGMLRGNSDEAIAWRAAHPWADELSEYQHVGMAGGAIAGPGRTDWESLCKTNPPRVVYVCDNDDVGMRALPLVSKAYGRALLGLMFDNRWPPSFDLKDVFPECFFRQRKLADAAGNIKVDRRYVGPRLREMLQPATWATTKVELPPVGRGRPRTVLRLHQHFALEWVYTKQDPPLYIHREIPHLRYTRINTAMRKFSDGDFSTELQRQALDVESLSYWPDRPTGVTNELNRRTFNDFVPPYIVLIRGTDADQARVLDFYTYLYPIEGERLEVLRWDATLVCRPEVFMGWGRLCISDTQGVGKTTHANILAALVGYHNSSFPSEAQIMSRFNGWLAHKRLVVANEIYAGHSWGAYLHIKSIITDRKIEVEEKFVPAYTVTNWAHCFLCSNSTDALRLEDADRRFHIPEIAEEPKDAAYWRDFHAWRSAGGLSHWLWFLQDFLTRNEPVPENSNAPLSDRKSRLIEGQYSAGKVLVVDVLEKLKEDYPDQNIFISEPALREILEHEFGDRQRQAIPSPQGVQKLVKARGWYMSKGRPWIAEETRKGRLISNSPIIQRVTSAEQLDDLREGNGDNAKTGSFKHVRVKGQL